MEVLFKAFNTYMIQFIYDVINTEKDLRSHVFMNNPMNLW